jgi:hypothetical protein
MRKSNKITVLIMALVIFVFGQLSAHAQTAVIGVIIWAIREDTKIALQIPQHATWCAKKHPGYRAKWNNYLIPNGRVKYCASPYHTPSWMSSAK